MNDLAVHPRGSAEPLLAHGGRLRGAAARYGIALADWLDLSTGINPDGWPVPPLPQEVWNRLPEDEDGLTVAARAYYETSHLLPVAGSQAAIQALPALLQSAAPATLRVGVLDPAYGEHAHAWRAAGHEVTAVAAERVEEAVTRLDLLTLINPNNPTGERFPLERLLGWAERLAERAGWLVVDEAFMDATPEESLARHSPRPGLIVLRSLGKFFGLAGARVGFVLAEPPLLRRLQRLIGPWSVAAPSRWMAERALADTRWQAETRRRLAEESTRLARLLRGYGLEPAGGCALFQWARTTDAAALHEGLARRGILTRLFADPQSLRFGLPGSEAGWGRLETALAEVRR